jgi:hypothetical protein
MIYLEPTGELAEEISANTQLLREAENEWYQFAKDQKLFLKKQRELRQQKKQQNNA